MTANGPAEDNNDAENDMDEELVDMIYSNDYLMEKIISYLPYLRDRTNLELCCKRLRRLSLRSLYIKPLIENSLLELNFMKLESVMSIHVAGNRFNVPALVSAERAPFGNKSDVCQPERCISAVRSICNRFRKQIFSIKLGSITDEERRLGYIPDHQLVITKDLITCFESLHNLSSLAIRNCCLTSSTIDFLNANNSKVINELKSLCVHSIWFDRQIDCTQFVAVIGNRLRRLCLSDCGTRTLNAIASRLSRLNARLDSIYLAIDFRTFGDIKSARLALHQISAACCEVHICICVTNFINMAGSSVLFKTLPLLHEFPRITSVELDLGTIRTQNFYAYRGFFDGLVRMENLRTLRISGQPINRFTLQVWNFMVGGIGRLTKLKELAIHGIAQSVKSQQLSLLLYALPRCLSSFVLKQARHIGDRQIQALIETCPELETIYLCDVRCLENKTFISLLRELPKLRKVGISHCGQINTELFELLLSRRAVRNLDALIIAASKDPLSNEMIEELRRHFNMIDFAGAPYQYRDSEYKMWTTRKAFDELEAALSFASCPGCNKDISLIEDDDFY